MALSTLAKIILALAAAGSAGVAYNAVTSKSGAPKAAQEKANMSQEEKVEYIADTMRDLQSLPGSASDGEINNWENQMKNLVNPQKQKPVLCQLYATQATMLAMVERTARQMGDQEMISDVQDDINAIPPGTLEDWLWQLARGGTRPAGYVKNECMQQPMVQVLNPGIRRNSQEMRDLEQQCLAAGTC